MFGKRHDHILRSIDRLRSEAPEALPNFGEGVYTRQDTGSQAHRLFEISRDGFALLAMGFTGAKALRFKLAYIAKFNAMEAELKAQAASSFASLSAPGGNIYDLRRILDP